MLRTASFRLDFRFFKIIFFYVNVTFTACNSFLKILFTPMPCNYFFSLKITMTRVIKFTLMLNCNKKKKNLKRNITAVQQ